MNRKWVIPVIVAALAGVVSFGVMRCFTRGCSCGSSAYPADVSVLARELKLNADQVREIEALHAALGAKLEDCCARHCAARARLGQALTGETNGVEQADAIIEEMCRAYEQSERATLDQIRQVRAVLDDDQRMRFDAVILSCMCGPCSSHGDGQCGAHASHQADGKAL